MRNNLKDIKCHFKDPLFDIRRVFKQFQLLHYLHRLNLIKVQVPYTTCTSYPMYPCTSYLIYPMYLIHMYPMYLIPIYPIYIRTSYPIYPMYPIYFISYVPHLLHTLYTLCAPFTSYPMYPMYLIPYIPHVPGTVVQRSKIRDSFAPHHPLPLYYIVFEWSLTDVCSRSCYIEN